MVGGCIRLYLRSQGGRCTWLPGGVPAGAAGALLLLLGASGTSLADMASDGCPDALALVRETLLCEGEFADPKLSGRGALGHGAVVTDTACDAADRRFIRARCIATLAPPAAAAGGSSAHGRRDLLRCTRLAGPEQNISISFLKH